MSSDFNSFDASEFGAFVESDFDARNFSGIRGADVFAWNAGASPRVIRLSGDGTLLWSGNTAGEVAPDVVTLSRGRYVILIGSGVIPWQVMQLICIGDDGGAFWARTCRNSWAHAIACKTSSDASVARVAFSEDYNKITVVSGSNVPLWSRTGPGTCEAITELPNGAGIVASFRVYPYSTLMAWNWAGDLLNSVAVTWRAYVLSYDATGQLYAIVPTEQSGVAYLCAVDNWSSILWQLPSYAGGRLMANVAQLAKAVNGVYATDWHPGTSTPRLRLVSREATQVGPTVERTVSPHGVDADDGPCLAMDPVTHAIEKRSLDGAVVWTYTPTTSGSPITGAAAFIPEVT